MFIYGLGFRIVCGRQANNMLLINISRTVILKVYNYVKRFSSTKLIPTEMIITTFILIYSVKFGFWT